MNEATGRLCTICARGGSKGVKGKNLRELAGKPLLAYSIEQARASGLFALVAVSSDSPAILDVAGRLEVDYLIDRPAELASDQAAKLPVIQHCVAEVKARSRREFTTLVDLDATSPLRHPEDIQAAVALLESTGASNVITAMPSRRSPYFNMVELNRAGFAELSKKLPSAVTRRQDAPRSYDMNASIYVWSGKSLFASESIFNPDTRLYVMPEERSIDIDSEFDFLFVEFLMKLRRPNPEGEF